MYGAKVLKVYPKQKEIWSMALKRNICKYSYTYKQYSTKN